MYLFVFIFLVIGLLGVYTQVLAVQTARIFSNQTGIGQIMLQWHSGEYSLASKIITRPSQGGSPCALTLGLAGVTPCTPSLGSNPNPVTLANGAGVVNSYADAGGNVYPHFQMPSGRTVSYVWYSIAYPSATTAQAYVITWAPPPASGNTADPITSPSIGISASELLQQLRNSGADMTGYGTVSAGQLMTVAGGLAYPVPAAVANGSVAVISSF